MAEKNIVAKSGEEKVKIKLFYDGNVYKDDVPVRVNGHVFRIKRGVEVEVPAYIAEALENSHVQKVHANEYMNNLQREFEEASKTV